MAKRDDLAVRFQGETISLATPADLKRTLDLRAIPGITRWNRLEGRPRSVDFEQAMRAEVRDPLWNLSKQWQVGEFKGEDAGSPAGASILIDQTRFRQFAADAHPFEPLDEREPLEMRIERQPLAWTFGDRKEALDLRLLLGRRWRKLLTAAGFQAHIAGFEQTYRIAVPAPADPAAADIVAHSAVWQRFDAVAGKMIDGGGLFLHLAEAATHRASDGIAGLTGPDALAIDGLGDGFVAWVRALLAMPEPGQDGWRPERLEYAASVTTIAAPGNETRDDEVLVAEEISDGRVDWYHFDRELRHQRPAPIHATEEPTAFLPSPLEYGGMPNPRWWQFEEGATNFGAIDPGSSDIGKLLFLDHVLLYANDWFIFPHRVAAGSNSLVRGLTVRNVFGERFWIEAAGSRQSDGWQGWGLFANNSVGNPLDLSDRHVTVLPVAGKIQDAESAEAMMLIRDEMANQVWTIEKTICAPSGQYLGGAALAAETRQFHQGLVGALVTTPVATEAALRYQLMTRVSENWIPFVAVHKDGDNRQTKLQRAAMPRLLDGDFGTPARVRPRTTLVREGLAELPRKAMFVETEEVPRSGIHLIDGFRRTRWYNGATFVWRGVRKHVGRGEGSSGLAFDQLFPKPLEQPAPAQIPAASPNAPIEFGGGPVPAVTLLAHPDPAGGWAIEVTTSNLTVVPAHDGMQHAAGEAQLRLLINGVPAARLYGQWYHLPPLFPGTYRLAIVAVSNDEHPLINEGAPIGAEFAIVQAEPLVPPAHATAPEVVGAPSAPNLALTVTGHPSGGYLLTVERENLTLAPLSVGGTHVPGEGYLELSVDDMNVARLYGDRFFFPPVSAGSHTIAITAMTNDHRPYATSTGPIAAEAQVYAVTGRPLVVAAPEVHDHDDNDHG